jgi:putative transposase
MLKTTYKYRVFPTKRQRAILKKTLEECCWLYNHFLEERKNVWKKNKKSLNYHSQAVSIPKLKKERQTLKSVHSQTLQNVAVRIDLAFKAFFRRVKAGEKPGYPRFKGKGWYDSFTYPQTGFKINKEKLELSKIGSVKIKLHRPVPKIIRTCTIRRQNNKWYVCFSCEVNPKLLKKSKKVIGIDVGIESFATFSTGEKIENPHFFKTEQKALAKTQRKLSKLGKQDPLRKKTKKVISRIHERIANRRNNFCHQISRKLVNCFGIICIEDLSINKMRENNFRSINRNIGDVAWGQFVQYLAYKAERAGRQLVRVNPAYTTQTCSKCGYREVKKLSDRTYHCPDCGLKIDRDHNSAINILTLGTQSLGRLQPVLRSSLL